LGLYPAGMPQTVEEVAYEASLRAIDRQYASLTDLRARSATLLAAAALVASVIGPDAIRASGGSISGWTVVGMAALVVVMTLILAILWPRSFTFRLSADVILDEHADKSGADISALLAFIARSQDRHHQANERVLDELRLCARAASVAVVVETLALLLAV
jgi:hypothetical protein